MSSNLVVGFGPWTNVGQVRRTARIRGGWVGGPGRAATLEVMVMEQVKHTVSVVRVLKWLDAVTTNPSELLKREKLKALLG